MRKVYLFVVMQLIILFLLMGPSLNASKASLVRKNNNKYAYSITDTTYRIVPAPANTYGYEIRIENKVLIRQLTIPGKSGVLGFRTKNDAGKVARLVIRKLSKGIMPPVIDEKDLSKLKINF